MNQKRVKITEISENVQNPRTISDTKLEKLIQSLLDFPEMLMIRPIVIGSDGISLGGNMRLKAIQEIREYSQPYKGEVLDIQRAKRMAMKPTKVQQDEFDEAINHLLYDNDLIVCDVSFLSKENQDEFIVKDNISFGEWDWPALDSLWGKEKVEDWGLDMPKWLEEKPEKNQEKEVSPDDLDTEHTCPKCGYEF